MSDSTMDLATSQEPAQPASSQDSASRDAGQEAGAGERKASASNARQERSGRTEREDRKENLIPHSRAEEMWRKREEKLHQEYGSKIADYERRLKEYAQPRPNEDRTSLLPPGFTEGNRGEEIGKLRSEMTGMTAGLRLDLRWGAFESVNRDVLEAPGARAALKAAFVDAFKKGLDPAREVQPLVGEFRELLTAKREASRQRREEQKRPDRKVVPSKKTWAPSGTPRASTSAKPTVAERIAARLQASRNGEY
jgi:hypothetical protein